MPIKVLFCYAREDERLLKKLRTHMMPLQRQGLIDVWYDRNIKAGTEWQREIDKNLNTANLVLLLVSPYFIASDYCYSIEMQRALERHERGEALVIPIILRHIDWEGVPFNSLQTLPKDNNPVTSRTWRNADEAFSDIVQGIRKAITSLNGSSKSREQGTHPTIGISVVKVDTISFNRQDDTISLYRQESEPIQSISDQPTLDMSPRNRIGILRIKDGKEHGKTYEINSTISIGRHQTSNILLEDLAVSRFHASIYVEGMGRYVLKDMDSRNGTLVNGRFIVKNAAYTLHDGDEIQLGETVLVFSFQ